MALGRHEELARVFNQRTPIAKTFGMTLAFRDDGSAEVTLPYNPELDHPEGGIQGGILATLLDCAGTYAAIVDRSPEDFVVTSEMSMHFLESVARTDLRAVGSVLRAGRSQTVAEMSVFDETGRRVAHGTGTFVATIQK